MDGSMEAASLQRELAHVNEQCQVAHTMAMAWKRKYQLCEEARARLERRLTPKEQRRAQRRYEEKRRSRLPGWIADLVPEPDEVDDAESEDAGAPVALDG
jgi:hypothetical protein